AGESEGTGECLCGGGDARESGGTVAIEELTGGEGGGAGAASTDTKRARECGLPVENVRSCGDDGAKREPIKRRGRRRECLRIACLELPRRTEARYPGASSR